MPDQKRRKKRLARMLKALLALVLTGVIGLAAWNYLIPMVTADAVTVYDSYTVGIGDISITKSFSANLSVKKCETFSSKAECTVKQLYVHSGDEVQEGDSLVLLSTGELFTAGFSGVVNELRVEVGDWVWPGITVVQINDLQHLEVSMNVDEYDIEQLSRGENCTVTVIAPGMDFETRIAHINRVSQSQGSVAFYSVTCDLTVPENVLPGMQATVTIPTESVRNVTTLNMDALTFDEDNQPYVLLRQDDETYGKNYVQTGLSDGMTVEITDGLSPGQTVYVVAGTESVQPTVTLESLYKKLVGETVIINDRSDRGGMNHMPEFSGDGAKRDSEVMPSPPEDDKSAIDTAIDETTSENGGDAAATATDD